MKDVTHSHEPNKELSPDSAALPNILDSFLVGNKDLRVFGSALVLSAGAREEEKTLYQPKTTHNRQTNI